MRKTAAFLLSMFFLFSFGLTILHPSYMMLSDWLGPVLGSHIYTLFAFFYLLFANPITYFVVSLIWILTGFIIGVISGKRVGSVITAAAVWFVSIIVLLSAFSGIYFNLEERALFSQESAQVLDLVPTVPKSFTFSKIFDTPIFSELFLQITELTTKSNSVEMSEIFFDLIIPHLLSIISKPLIIIISALIGAILSPKIIEYIYNLTPSRRTLLTLILITTLAINPILVGAINLDDGIYTELLGGYVEEKGRSVLFELILGDQFETLPMDSPEAEGLVASFVVTHMINDPSILYTLQLENITDYLHFYRLLPNTVAVNIYLGEDIDQIEEKSDKIINELEQLLKISFNHLFAFPIPRENISESSLPPMTAVLYYSKSTFDETIENILFDFIEIEGFSSYIEEKLDSDPLDIEFYARGFFLVEPFKQLLPISEVPLEYETEYNYLIESKLSFFAGIQLKKDSIKRLGTNNIFDIREIADVETLPTYNPESDGSFVILARSNKTGVSNPLDPTVSIKTSIPENNLELMYLTYFTQNLGVQEIHSGTPTQQDTQINIPFVNTQTVTLEKTVTENTGEISISLKVNNNEKEAITNVELTDLYPEKYGEPSSRYKTWNRIEPGETRTHTYNLNIKNPGIYTDVPATLTYNINGTTQSVCSNTIQSYNKQINPTTMIKDNYKGLMSLTDKITNNKGYLLNFMIITYILIVAGLDVFKYLKNHPQIGLNKSI